MPFLNNKLTWTFDQHNCRPFRTIRAWPSFEKGLNFFHVTSKVKRITSREWGCKAGMCNEGEVSFELLIHMVILIILISPNRPEAGPFLCF